jgi:uncharacterized membrane protein
MKRWIGPLALCVIAALGAHWAALALAPSVIMDRALATLEDRGIALHAFTTPRRISPQTQVVVRSSPDLFYSLCRYDFGKVDGGAIRVTMGEWPDYQSLSFFDADTNNFATIRSPGERHTMLLVSPEADNGSRHPSSPTMRGVILIRRLAPTQEAFDRAAQAAQADRCEPLPGLREDIERQLKDSGLLKQGGT